MLGASFMISTAQTLTSLRTCEGRNEKREQLNVLLIIFTLAKKSVNEKDKLDQVIYSNQQGVKFLRQIN